MIARIQAEQGIYVQLPVDVTWQATVTNRMGRCQLRVSRNSPAWNAEMIDEDGGFLVEIITPFGLWRGVADIPQWEPAGMLVEVSHVAVWLEDLRVGFGRFIGVTAGVVFDAVFRQALAGRGATALKRGSVIYAPPLVPEIDLDRRTVVDVLTELNELTGQEWVLDLDGQLHWLPRQGRYHDLPPIVDDGRLFPTLSPGTLDDRPAEVIEVHEGGRSFSVWSDDARPLRPRTSVERV